MRPMATGAGTPFRLSGGDRGTAVEDRQTLNPKLKALLEENDRPKDGFVFCASCSHVIAHLQDRIEVNGSFEHTCTNPHGFVHHFGCHRDALGCAISGPPHAADSWFAGFIWQLASCGNCDQHMGWLFRRVDDQFYGLILDRIQTG